MVVPGVTGVPIRPRGVLVERSCRAEDGACRHLLVWRAGPGWRMLSSAVLGGGIGERKWLINAQVRSGYDRMDPDRHLAELAEAHGLAGEGVGLMTAAFGGPRSPWGARLARAVHRAVREGAERDRVRRADGPLRDHPVAVPACRHTERLWQR